MQFLKVVFILLAAVIAVVAILLQKFSSDELLTLVSVPTLTASLQNFFTNVIYPDSGSAKKKSSSGSKKSRKSKEKLLTADELKLYDGKEGSKGLYLALLGQIFNVKKGSKHYGPGGGYDFFSGRDASRAFVSGDFTEEGLTDDIEGLASADYIGLDDWIKFYHNDYKYVGKLIGRYYDERGEQTEYAVKAQEWIAKAHQEKEGENQEKKIFPPCNSEWSQQSGSRLWCTTGSGGIDREWTGVPRKLYTPGKGNARCACVKNFGPPSHDPSRQDHDDQGDLANPNLEEYEGCDPKETFCYITNL